PGRLAREVEHWSRRSTEHPLALAVGVNLQAVLSGPLYVPARVSPARLFVPSPSRLPRLSHSLAVLPSSPPTRYLQPHPVFDRLPLHMWSIRDWRPHSSAACALTTPQG